MPRARDCPNPKLIEGARAPSDGQIQLRLDLGLPLEDESETPSSHTAPHQIVAKDEIVAKNVANGDLRKSTSRW
jgi:hypothetical protein